MDTSPVRIVLADDDDSFRGMVRVLLSGDPRFEVVGEARNGQEAVDRCAELQPDTVVIDLHMPVMDGDAAVAEIRRLCACIDVVAVSGMSWAAKEGPMPDACIEKGTSGWMDFLPEIIAVLHQERTAAVAGGGGA